MRLFLRRLAAVALISAATIPLSGCVSTFSYNICSSGQCNVNFYFHVTTFYTCYVGQSTPAGCLNVPPDCNFPPVCGLQPSTNYQACAYCQDPILAQWPNAWTVMSAQWFNLSTLASGTVLIESASSFSLPAGVGPIVTNPGYSAHVLRMNLDNLPLADYQIIIRVNMGSVPTACVSGIEVGMITLNPGGLRLIAPLAGESLDLTSYHAPDPHFICVGDNATPAHLPTWGGLKVIYR